MANYSRTVDFLPAPVFQHKNKENKRNDGGKCLLSVSLHYMSYPKIIIVGGGFGGLNVAKSLKNAKVDILVIDRTNHHLFQPLLYQVATASLSPANIATPIREVLQKQDNTTVIMGEVVDVDKENKLVIMGNGETYPFDYLVLATGARHSYFGHPEWEKFAPGLKTLDDALGIRQQILLAFERAERSDRISLASKNLRFIIIGAGPTGVEMAGAIAEIAHYTMFHNFRRIHPEQAEIFLIEGESQILPSYPKHLADKGQGDLEKLGVKVLLNTKVTDITAKGVHVGEKLIESTNIIWAAGNQVNGPVKALNAPSDRAGRVLVNPDLSIPGYPYIFVIGDAAHFTTPDGNTLPGIAPVAIQQARYLAKNIKQFLPFEKRAPFTYKDKGMMATIGKAKAVAIMGKREFSGYFAWLAWSLIHVFYLISFSNRFLVMTQWFFWYLTGERNARLITQPIDDKTATLPSEAMKK